MSAAEMLRIANDLCGMKHAGRHDRRSRVTGGTTEMLQIEQNRSDPRERHRYVALDNLVVTLR